MGTLRILWYTSNNLKSQSRHFLYSFTMILTSACRYLEGARADLQYLKNQQFSVKFACQAEIKHQVVKGTGHRMDSCVEYLILHQS
jgi:hypothetical protein